MEQLQITGPRAELDSLYHEILRAEPTLSEDEIRQGRPASRQEQEPFTALLLIVVIDKTIDILKDIIERRADRRAELKFAISKDGGKPEELTPEELIRRVAPESEKKNS